MARLNLFLFGSPRFEQDRLPLPLKRRKAIALLIYLAVTGEIHSREALATLLWPDYEASRSRAYLRRELAAINKALGEGWLMADREQIGLDAKAPIWLDVDQFRQETQSKSDDAGETDVTKLTEAVALYRGDFLAGFTLPDAPDFDEWHFFQAESLRQRLGNTLERLINLLSRQAAFEQAIPHARHLVSLDPLHEPAHRHLMRLYAWHGQQAAALRQYEECVRLLAEELGASPEDETVALYEVIKAKQLELPIVEPLPSQGFDQMGNGGTSTNRSGPQAMPDLLAQEDLDPTPPFVARERELADLAAGLETARRQNGQITFVIGGAGRGKTMLINEFVHRSHKAIPDLLVATGYCNAHTGLGDPYLPFREALTVLLGEVEAKRASGLIDAAQAQRLWEAMPLTISALVEHAPDLLETFIPLKPIYERAATFASTEVGWYERLSTLVMTGPQKKLEQPTLFAQYTRLLKAIAAERPLLLILEDLHWVDAPSVALLFHLSRQLEGTHILILGTYRPDEIAVSWNDVQHPLASVVREMKRQHGDIWLDLGDLAPTEGRQFVDAYLDTQPNDFDESFRERLFQHTDGHALFTVELLRDMRDRGDIQPDERGRWQVSKTIDWQSLPAKVEGVIETRIHRLGQEQQALLNVASVEGEIFTAEVIARVQQLNERDLVRQLSRELDKQHRLVTAQALERLAAQRLSRYRFRHQLFQHYLYHSLDDMERTYLHEEVGLVLETVFGDDAGRIAVQLARHFEQAGLIEKAVDYLLQAGKQASQVSAHKETIAHLTKGLDLVKTLSDSPERVQLELNLQVAIGPAYRAIGGYTAPELEQTYRRARQLCQSLGDTPQVVPVLWGLWSFYLARAEHQTALELAEQCFRAAQHSQDPALLMSAHRALGSSQFWRGEFTVARMQLESGFALYDRRIHKSVTLLTGYDPGVNCLSYLMWTLWVQGYPDQSRDYSQATINLARDLDHPFSLAFALFFEAMHRQFLRQAQSAKAVLEENLRMAKEQGFLVWEALSTGIYGWVLGEEEEFETGINMARAGIAQWRALGSELVCSYLLSILAETYLKAGRVTEGLTVIDEALAGVEQTDERFWAAEIYRLKGELYRCQTNADADAKTEAYFRQAIEIAQNQGAKSLELRAVMSLGRLWHQQGKSDLAAKHLTEIYEWFSEGFDTSDLQEAQEFLHELGVKVDKITPAVKRQNPMSQWVLIRNYLAAILNDPLPDLSMLRPDCPPTPVRQIGQVC